MQWLNLEPLVLRALGARELRGAWQDHTASKNVVIVFVWHATGEAINNALHLAAAFLAGAIGWLIRTKAAGQP
jgi:hypothetical protein